MFILFILAPTLAQLVTKPVVSSRSQLAFKAPLLARNYRPAQRIPLVNSFAPQYAPEYAPSFAEGGGKPVKSSYGSSYGSRSTSYVRPSAEATYDKSGLSPDQLAFLARQRGETGFGGGLDTHGRPSGGGAAPAPAPAPASASGEFAGMTQDQIDFIRRKRGEIGMTGGLDTHGRPRMHAKESPSVLGIITVGVLGFLTGSVGFFGILRFRHSLSVTFRNPLLSA